eukprot:TRINITY_DN6172_c0_g1_i1.p1 TRINITY_DN6172_c0_g1~~TRINITY_DN6172_c0_g1_i1.p1  ORF type:complete len:275 (-),score=57.82 TRINITY_DN6172_c0_g1_i1:9-833(-)
MKDIKVGHEDGAHDDKSHKRKSVDSADSESSSPSKKQKKDDNSSTIEKGRIYFFTRPSSDEKDSVIFLIVLAPSSDQLKPRLLSLEQSSLPSKEEDLEFTAEVNLVASELTHIDTKLGEVVAKEGEEALKAATEVAEGCYSIDAADGHTYLSYTVHFPEELNNEARSLNIEQQGSLHISVKNPQSLAAKVETEGDETLYPEKVLDELPEEKRLVAVESKLLDFEGAQIALRITGKISQEKLKDLRVFEHLEATEESKKEAKEINKGLVHFVHSA